MHKNTKMDNSIFNDLFVLELANNHLGSVERGLKIIAEFAQIVRFNNVRATIKLQFRDVNTFIHKDYITRDDIRYIKDDRKLLFAPFPKLARAVSSRGALKAAWGSAEHTNRQKGWLGSRRRKAVKSRVW